MSVAGTPTSGLLTEAWELFKRHWQHLVAIAFVVYLVIGLLAWIVIETITLLGVLLLFVVGFIGGYILQGALVRAVDDVRDGRADLSIGETFRSVMPRLAPIIGASVLAGIGIGIGLILLIIPGIILLTLWILIVPVVVLENSRVFDSFRRSYELVRPYFWQTLGVIALTILVQFVANFLLGLVLTPLPTGVETFVSTLIGGSVIGPYVAVVWTILYFRLRDAQRGTTPSPGPGPAAP